jgi:hypothetical protein
MLRNFVYVYRVLMSIGLIYHRYRIFRIKFIHLNCLFCVQYFAYLYLTFRTAFFLKQNKDIDILNE